MAALNIIQERDAKPLSGVQRPSGVQRVITTGGSAWLALGLVLLAGCSDATGQGDSTAVSSPNPEEGPVADGADARGALPKLKAGMTFTFEGQFLYDQLDKFTIVVVNTTDGQLFAGSTPEDTRYAAIWGHLLWGPRDANLNDEYAKILSFPLFDGKTWDVYEGMTVVARAADVRTPLGSEAGFVIEGTRDHYAISADFAPSIGYLTHFETRSNEALQDSVSMTAIGTATEGTWFETGSDVYAVYNEPPATLDVPPGFDAVIISAGGLGGARAVGGPVAASTPWSWENPSMEETWESVAMEATPGPWVYQALAPADGWVYMRSLPVKWTPLPVE
jgi:hypothetical protein